MILCRCGHPAYEHHTSLTRDGGSVYGECLHYGFNESGGMRRARFGWFGRRRRWIDNCYRFTPLEARCAVSTPEDIADFDYPCAGVGWCKRHGATHGPASGLY